jgi:hypothetical protein
MTTTPLMLLEAARTIAKNLGLDLISMVGYEDEYQVVRIYDEEVLFQGDEDRCSDFIKGYDGALSIVLKLFGK